LKRFRHVPESPLVRTIWRVTFRGRLPGQPPRPFETILVEVDRQSGEVVSIARS
jgi:hypothetical protein